MADIQTAPTLASVTINRPVDEVYDAFRDFSGLPRFMDNLLSIDVIDADRSHWIAKAPAGQTVEWNARIIEEHSGSSIAWESEPGADVSNRGRVTFRDAGARGTVVVAEISYDPPVGTIGKLVAKLFQREPAIQARRDMRRFKQFLETGEVATAARTQAMFEEEEA